MDSQELEKLLAHIHLHHHEQFTNEDINWILQQSGRWPILLEIFCGERLAALLNEETDDLWKREALAQIQAMPDLRRLYSGNMTN